MGLLYSRKIKTPIGSMHAAASSNGICMFEYDDPLRVGKNHSVFEESFEIQDAPSDHDLLNQLEKELFEYFAGDRKSFSLKLDLIGTDFQRNVWNELLNIEYGTTRSYLEQSKALGDINAIRAVANANGQNRISIIVPCHRVIGSNGSLTGYGGELWRKKYLLELESEQLSLF